MSVLHLLQSIPFFSSLTKDDHLDMLEHIRLHYFPAGHIIFREGDNADAMYIIRSGSVRIFHKKENCETTVAVLKYHDFFGEMALVNNSERNASVEVLEDCEVFALHKEDLAELLEAKPHIAKMLSDTFVQRTKENTTND